MKDKFAKQKRVKVGEISDNATEGAKITLEKTEEEKQTKEGGKTII